jgi:hypothetical protein
MRGTTSSSGVEPTGTGTTARATEYNYRHFGPEYYDFRSFEGPEPGDSAPAFEATTLDGETVSLAEFRGNWVVLETGSITCPITDSKVHAMDELQRQFEDVVCILLYTREAHPGENYDAHASFEEKLERARTFADDYGIERTVLVDDVDGTAHRRYGGLPNSVHIIDPEGMVVMRGDWNSVSKVKEVLENGTPGRIYDRDRYAGRPLFFTSKKGFVRVYRDAGPRAVVDSVRTAPALALMHLKELLNRLPGR